MPPNSFADATTGFTALWNADMERRSAIFPEPAMISQYESANGYTEDNDWMFNDEWQNFDRFDPGPHRSPLPDRPGSASSSIIGDGWSKHEPMDETLPKVYTLDAPLTQEAFLEWYPYGNATLTFTNDQNKLQSIPNVNLELIGQQSVLLALAFEDLRAGPQLHLETLTSATAFPFLRFLYTGTYALTEPTGDWYEDVPTSVLLHCQLYHLGDIYDLEGLKTQAYVNVLRQAEFGCSSPDKPIDLCAAIRYLYQHLPKATRLIDTILDYCVQCFVQHHLEHDEEFRTLAYELRPFHQALGKNSRDRGFDHEAAAAIIRLPFKPYVPEAYASREDALALRFDDVFHFHEDIEPTQSRRKMLPRSLRQVGDPVLASSSKADTKSAISWRERLDYENWPLPSRKRASPSALSDSDEHMSDDVPKRYSKKAITTSQAESASSRALETALDKSRQLPLRPSTVTFSSSRATSQSSEVTQSKHGEVPQDLPDEFELLERPAEVEAISDTESDSTGIIEVQHEDARTPSESSCRSPSVRFKIDGDWDTDWQLL